MQELPEQHLPVQLFDRGFLPAMRTIITRDGMIAIQAGGGRGGVVVNKYNQ